MGQTSGWQATPGPQPTELRALAKGPSARRRHCTRALSAGKSVLSESTAHHAAVVGVDVVPLVQAVPAGGTAGEHARRVSSARAQP